MSIINNIDFKANALDLLNAGIKEFFKKNYDSSIKLIEESNKIFTDINDIPNIAISLSELALVQYKKSGLNLANSNLLLNKAGKLIINEPNTEEIKAKITHYYGKLHFYEKHLTESLIYYAKALKQANENSLEHARILDSLAVFYLRLNNHKISIKCLQKSLNIKKKSDNREELAFTELLFGRHLLNIENYESASVHLNKALILNENEGYESFKARTLEELAKIHIYIEDYEMAEKFCQKAIALSKDADSKLLLAFSQVTMANIMALTGKIDRAFELINEISPIFTELNNARGKAFLDQVRGVAYFNIGDTNKAIDSLNSSMQTFKTLGIYKEIVRNYYYIANIYKYNHDIQLSLEYTLEAIRIAKANNFPFLTNKIETLLSDLVEKELANITDTSVITDDVIQHSSSLLDNISLFGNISICNNIQDPLISLLKIGKAIYNETDPNKILKIAAFETQNAMNADRCSIFLYDKNTNELYSKIASGMHSQEIRFPANMGMAGYVFNSGQIVKIDDAYSDANFNKEIDIKTGYKTNTILCMPLRNSKQEIIGIFQVINKLNNEIFTDKDIELLISISSSVGVSLDNANLLKNQLLMYEDQKKSFNSFINTLAASIDARDKITAGHSTRVTAYTLAIADQLSMNIEEKEVLEYAAILHDIGKIGVKDEVLCKEGKLTDEEYKHIQEHANITYEILNKMYFEDRLKKVPEIAASHHEKYNGKGYYKGLAGEDIPIGGRIIAIADVFDAITSKRHYRDRMPFKQVLTILEKDSGSHFDGKIVNEFFKIKLDIITKILSSRYKDSVSSEELKMLESYSIKELFIILNKDISELNDNENCLLETFSKHYIGE